MFAVIRAAGKQYVAVPGQKIKLDKHLNAEESGRVVFGEVLLVADGDEVMIGTPLVKDTEVIGKVARQGRGRKIITMKFKPKKRYKKKIGHKQPFTEVTIESISKPGAKPKPATPQKKSLAKSEA
jgi:large subunit ribosomal protein L21